MSEPSGSRLPFTDRSDASAFVASLATTMTDLGRLLEEQADALAAGRMRDGLAREAEKTELAGRYLNGVERTRANAVALARLVPDLLPGLRATQGALAGHAKRNQAVLATAQAVSEGLVKAVSDDMARRSRPAGYGAPPPARRGEPGRPLAYSARF